MPAPPDLSPAMVGGATTGVRWSARGCKQALQNTAISFFVLPPDRRPSRISVSRRRENAGSRFRIAARGSNAA